MRYVVDVNGEAVTLDVTPEGVRLVDAAGTPGDLVRAELTETADSPVAVLRLGDAVIRLVVRRDSASRGSYTLVVDGERYVVDAADERTRAVRAVVRSTATAHCHTVLRAPMPGLVVRVAVAPGDRVESGDRMVVMEAMKMENELRAPASGTVRTVAVAAGMAVEKGALLVELE